MSLKPTTLYTIVCDWPGCAADFFTDTEYTAYSKEDVGLVFDDSQSGWWTAADFEKHYCPEHPMVWASDLEDGLDDEPERPYLLIHDGDTPNPADDGHVTLKEAD